MGDIVLPTYEAFLSFLFDELFLAPSGEFLRETTVGTPWYDDLDVDLDATTCARYYIRLLETSADLGNQHSHKAIESAFAAMIDCNFPLSVSELVWDVRVPLETREELIA